MDTHSLNAPNFAYGYPNSTVDAASMERMFGPEVCVPGSNPCRLTPIAAAWSRKANATMTGGRCEGFAVLSTLFFTGDINPVDFGALDGRALDLAGNEALQRELAYWHVTQLVPPVTGEKTRQLSAKTVMPVLAEALKPDAKERFRIGIQKKSNGKVVGGHALTPISYSQGDRKGLYLVRVYDSNLPDVERELSIDTEADRWEYEAARNPKERASLFFGDSSNANPLFLTPVKTRLGVLPCAFCNPGKVSVQSSGGVQATVTSGGATASVKDGTLSASEGAAASPVLSQFEGEAASFVFELPADGETRIALSGAEPGAGSVSAFGRGYAAEASGLSVPTASTDTLTVGPGGESVRYENASKTDVRLAATVERPSGQTLTVEATVAGGSSQVEATIDARTGQVGVVTQGAQNSDISISVTRAETDGGAQTGSFAFRASADAGTQAVAIPTEMWTADAGLPGTIDDGSGPRPAVDLCTNGTQDGTESDVDCGGMCAAKCAPSARCSSASDCSSGLCSVAGRCVDSTCQDGRRSGTETDVDCGGSTCGACAAGLACGQATDCLTSFCQGQVCRAASVVGVEVSGLPTGDSVTLQNNGTDELTVAGNGSFRFTSPVLGPYVVAVTSQPLTATCSVTGGSGTATGAAVLITVSCVATWQVGGTVTGLPVGETVTLLNAGADPVTVLSDGPFVFSTRVTGAYAVSVGTQPSTARCSIAGAFGTATSDVSSLQVSCAPVWRIGGTVAGLPASTSVTLLNNGGDPLVVSANGPFTFSTAVLGAYNVTIASQPIGGACAVVNGSGTATTNVSSVQINCLSGFGIGGSLSGLPAATTVTLTNNGGDPLVLSANGAFAFSLPVTSYAVAVQTQPSGATCRVTNGVGTATAPVSSVLVACVLSGTLDTSFNGTGFFTLAPTGFHNEWFDMTINPDDSQVFVGRNQVGGADEDWAIVKLTAGGQLDSSFGTGGSVGISRGSAIGEAARAIVRVGTGYVIGGTFREASGFDVGVQKLTLAGALDNTFGTNGRVSVDFGNNDYLRQLVIDSSGRMVIAGSTGDGTNAQVLIARLTPTGALDTSFGTGGSFIGGNAGADDMAWSVAIDGAGRIWAVGSSDANTLMLRLTPSGALDTTFGTTGLVITDVTGATRPDELRRIVVEPGDTSAVAAGRLTNASGNLDGLLLRISNAGQVAQSVTLDRSGTNDFFMALDLLPDGRVFVAGGSALTMLIARYTSSLVLDSTFGTGGVVQPSFGITAQANFIKRDSQGRILAGGTIGPFNPDYGVCRLNP
jgi:uncharacterized delta-60 repeat protein